MPMHAPRRAQPKDYLTTGAVPATPEQQNFAMPDSCTHRACLRHPCCCATHRSVTCLMKVHLAPTQCNVRMRRLYQTTLVQPNKRLLSCDSAYVAWTHVPAVSQRRSLQPLQVHPTTPVREASFDTVRKIRAIHERNTQEYTGACIATARACK